MPSIFDANDKQDIIKRIQKLHAKDRPGWGNMNVSQMLAHCQEPIKGALGDTRLKHSLVGMLFGKMAKKQMLSDKPFKQGLPTDKTFVVRDERNFEKEREQLVGLVERLHNSGADGIAKGPHPFFGKMTSTEWDTLMWKHLDHHLRQFGV